MFRGPVMEPKPNTKYSVKNKSTPPRAEGVILVCLTLSCPGTGRAVVKIGHSNLRHSRKELSNNKGYAKLNVSTSAFQGHMT